MAGTTKNKGILRNPAVLAAASTPAGQNALTKSTEITANAANKGIDLLSWGIKLAVLCGGAYYVVSLFKKRFINMNTNSNYAPSNITDGQAVAKADALYEAMYGVGADVDIVATQIAGLNYNGWVKVYNAFGNRKGVNPLGDAMNLVEWFNDQFDEDELLQLRFLVSGVFRNAETAHWTTEFLTKKI